MNHFPDQNNAVKWLIKYVIPFVNASSQKDIISVFVDALNDLITPQFRFEGAGVFKILDPVEQAKEFLGDGEFVATVILSHGFIKSMLSIALNKPESKLPDDLETQIADIETKIQDYFSDKSEIKVSWKGFGKNYVRIKNTSLGYINTVEEVMVKSIVSCAYSTFIGNHGDASAFSSGIGLQKVGRCQNCGRFFEKKRKDQEYCSKKCGDAVRARRSYNSKKGK